MDRKGFANRRRIGSVKAATNLYGEGIHEGNSPLKKPQMDSLEKHSRKRELHQARREIGQLNESRTVADSIKSQTESELSHAKKTVRDLTLMIDEANSKAKQQMKNMEKLKKPERGNKEWAMAFGNNENNQYADVMKELEYVKQELSKLKLDMASVFEKKIRAERETEASSLKMITYSSAVEALKEEIDEVNEEEVLVELARIEALKEFGAIEVQKKKEANQYSSAMEENRKKMVDIIQEIDHAKELESKLAATTSDVNVLQSELKVVKKMDRRIERNGASFRKVEESDSPALLFSVTEELEKAKEELASIREEGFQFMASMDVIRDELKHVSEETARLNKTKEKVDLTVQNFNQKLLRAKAKLEDASAAEEKAKTIVSNLSCTLGQLKTEAEAAKTERELIREETASIKAEVQKTESEIDLAEERLQAAMQELEEAKSSEALALENLKTLIDNAMRARASSSQHSSTITISTFEYEYLTGHAVGAEEIANKKVAAAQAWVEALKASEREIIMKTKLAHRKIRELRVEEEEETYRKERSLSAKRVFEGESKNWRQKSNKNLKVEVAIPRKSANRSGNSTPVRRAKFQKSASPAVRLTPRTTSYAIRRRKKVLPNLAKLFSSKRVKRDL